MRFLPLVFLLGACLEADLIPCGESLCPQDKVCAPDGRCLAPTLLEQCANQAEGTPCDALEGVDGRCANGICEQVSCGNGFVDEQLTEECDGGEAAQCVDFGFDLGRAACVSCSFDTTPCVRFGWVRIEYASSQKMWTDGTILAYTTYAPKGLAVQGGGFTVHSADEYLAVEGGNGHVFAIAATGEVVEAAGNSLVTLGMPTAAPIDLAVADDGVPYVLGADCRVFAYDGAWTELGTQLPIGVADCHLLAVLGSGPGTRIAVAKPDGGLWLDDGHDRFTSAGMAPTTISVLELHETYVWVGGATGVYRTPIASPTTFETRIANHGITSLAFIGSAFYATTTEGTLLHRTAKTTDTLRGPTGGRVVDDGHDGLYMFQGPIYRFTGTSYSELVGPPIDVIQDQLVASCRTRTRDILVISGQNLFSLDVAGVWSTFPSPVSTSLRGVACQGSQVAIVSHSNDNNSTLARSTTGPSGTFQIIPTSDAVKEAVWLGVGTMFVVGTTGAGAAANSSPGWIGELANGVIDELVLPDALGACRLFAVSGTDVDGILDVVAAGRCDDRGVVLERVGFRDWNVVYRSPTNDGGFRSILRVPATNALGYMIFAAGEGGAVWFDGTWHADASVIGRTLSGTAEDMWLSGAFTDLQHFDGTVWSQVATSALSQIAVFAQETDVLLPGGAPGHVQLLRDKEIVPP